MAGDTPQPFDEAAILAESRASASLTDFGDEDFRQPLSALLTSLAEASLTEMGVGLMRGAIVKSLVTRLRTVDWITRYPEITDERIEAPIVVVGMMRSGTTLLQRVLAADPRHYSVLGWEVNEPAPRPDTRWDQPDPRIADAEAGDEQLRTFAPDLYAIHPMDAHKAEEEIMILADAFLSHVPEASCNVPAYRAWLNERDFTPAYVHLKRTLQLLQWQKKQRGQHLRRWVLKTPAHLGYLDTLFAVFPESHVVHMHRDPVATIASGASLNLTLWKMHTDDVDPTLVGSQWLDRMSWANRRAMAVREGMHDEGRRNFTDVWFRDAIDDPLRQVERVYGDIGLEFTPGTRRAMEAWLEAEAHEPRAHHSYTPEQFGLSAERIRAEFADYIARHCAPREEG